jgi:branched-chain amino acid transport system permease protein
MVNLLVNLVNGLSLGSVYAIIALGYTMVYGIAKMLNFAHGDVIMVGAYAAYVALRSLNMPPLVATLIAMVVCTLLGILIEKTAYKPLRQATYLAVLITAIGVSYFLQNMAQLIWGATPVNFPADFITLPSISLMDGKLLIEGATLITILAGAVIMVGLTLFINRTKVGKAMRAVSEDRGAAELMGINVNRTISITFAIGSALAAIAGILLWAKVFKLEPTTGALPGIKAFTAAVLGGIGSIPGAMLGGVLLGVIEIFGRAYISTALSDAIVFSVLIIVLLVRPTGLLGKAVREKV